MILDIGRARKSHLTPKSARAGEFHQRCPSRLKRNRRTGSDSELGGSRGNDRSDDELDGSVGTVEDGSHFDVDLCVLASGRQSVSLGKVLVSASEYDERQRDSS